MESPSEGRLFWISSFAITVQDQLNLFPTINLFSPLFILHLAKGCTKPICFKLGVKSRKEIENEQ